MKFKTISIALSTLVVVAGSALAQNFDTLSFNNKVKFAGALMTGTVSLSTDCTPDPMFPLGPDDRCIPLFPSPARTDFDVTDDIGRTVLPKNTAKTMIYQITNVNWVYQFNNQTGAPTIPAERARFNVTPYVTLESDALNDPSCLDPNTIPPNQPCNGKIIEFLTASHLVSRSLTTGEVDTQSLSFSRCGGAGIGKLTLLAQGIPPNIVDKMFKGPITIRAHIRGSVRHVDTGSLFYQVRIFVDE